MTQMDRWDLDDLWSMTKEERQVILLKDPRRPKTEEKLSLRQICEMCDVTITTVRNWLFTSVEGIEGLPFHREIEGARDRVFVSNQDLFDWLLTYRPRKATKIWGDI